MIIPTVKVFVDLFLLSVPFVGSSHDTLFSFGTKLSFTVNCSLHLRKYLER